MAIKDWDQWRDDSDYKMWSNKKSGEKVTLAMWRKKWRFQVKKGDMYPLIDFDELSRASAFSKAKNYMRKN